jgi:hypothetical protein
MRAEADLASILLRSVSHEETAEHRRVLASWHAPAAFDAAVSEFKRRLTHAEFFNVPALGFLRDAWTLGRFACLAPEVVSVRMEPSEFPDGYAKLKTGDTLEIEVTEALMPDRRRGEEFLPGMPTVTHDPGEEWDRRLDALPGVLDATIARKAGKRYSRSLTLLVYLNISAYGHREDEMIGAIAEVRERWCSHFAGVRILWQDHLV